VSRIMNAFTAYRDRFIAAKSYEINGMLISNLGQSGIQPDALTGTALSEQP